MAAKKGSLFLLAVSGIGSPLVFQSLLTSRSTEFTINNEVVDVTNKGSAGWRTAIDAGIKNMSVSIDGVFEDSAAEILVNGFSINGGINNFQVINEDGDTWTGTFILTSYSRSGTYNGEETYSFSLESAGVIVYVAA